LESFILRRPIILAWPAAVLFLLATCLAPALVAQPGIRIDPAKTWVGLARVHLTVTEVELADRQLEGAYRIRVPFLPGKNDTGTLQLRSARPLDEVQRFGGTLDGTALSVSGEIREFVCDIRPDGTMRIDIAMEDRMVSFKTRYSLPMGS
jgi:hypothetical protein